MKITKAFDVVVNGKQYEIRVEDDGRVRCFALVDGAAGQELAKGLNFAELAWRTDAERCLQAEADALPIVFVSALCSEMPEELTPRPAEELLVLRNEVYEYDIVVKAGKARSIVEAALERRRLGSINVGEAAFLLAQQDGASLRDYRTLIFAAFKQGLLHFVDSLPPRIGIDAVGGMAHLEKHGLNHPGYLIHDEWAFTIPADVNRWLDGIDPRGFMPRIDLRLPLKPTSSPDLALLATRQQLIDAFGAFTGMDQGWFKNLKDSPALLDARKIKGSGGRGHLEEPLFCPVDVMRWLVSDTRKKGIKLGEGKAWELLEKHFPKAYSAHSAADPRET